MPSTVVVIPTYNERTNLPVVVRRVLAAAEAAQLDVHVLVVDDGSPDGTGDVADELSVADPRIDALHRTRKEGLGRAYLAGFDWALHRGFDVVVEMDADGSHHPEELPRLVHALQDADLALGSRWIPGGRVEHWPLRRRLLSRGGNRYARAALGIDVRDATGGFRAFRADALRRIPLETVASQGYCFQVDLLWRALTAGLAVTEVPITFTERTIGRSKMSGRIVLESLLRVTGWGVRRRVAEGRELLLHHRRLPSVRGGHVHSA